MTDCTGKLQVLVIDNNPDLIGMFEAATDENVQIKLMTSEVEALEFLQHNRMDAVLIDLAMPTLDGVTCVEEIRNNETTDPGKPPVHLAFYTGHTVEGNEVIEEVIDKSNVEKVFRKPITPFELIEEIKQWLNCSDKKPVASS